MYSLFVAAGSAAAAKDASGQVPGHSLELLSVGLFCRAACASDGACTGGAGWAWLVCLQQAILDKSAALQCVQNLSTATFSNSQPGSNGNSLTDALYWIGTR